MRSSTEKMPAGDHSIYGKAPVGEPALLKALEFLAQRSDFVRERIFRNLAASEFTRQGVSQ